MVDGVELLFRPLMMLVRFLVWFAWELFIEVIIWSIGWVVCKAITFGAWPKVKLNEHKSIYWVEALIVEMIGLAAIFLLIYAFLA